MSKPKIIVHCLVKNEERFIWYAIKSVLPFVDKIMVWDTGSTDNTLQIVKAIKSKKIKFKQLKSVTPKTFTKASQQMIDQTPKDTTWIMILDGDEIWPKDSIKKVIEFAKNNTEAESIVVRTNNLVGDIYHRLPKSAGHYQIAGQKGHLSIRLMNYKKIPGLHFDLPHGQRGLFDKNNKLIQDRDPNKIKFINVSYHHATHLVRSSKDNMTIKRKQKFKYELGQKIPPQEIPKIFFTSRPTIVSLVTKERGFGFFALALIQTPLRKLRRTILPVKSGY